MNIELHLRPYTEADATSCWRLFHDTVRRVNSRDYTPAQVNAWANADIDPEPWFRRFDGKIAYVVASDEEVLGFADLASDGYLDRLFVSTNHQRRGIATMLMNAIEHAAKEITLPRIHTQASITAKPFFLSRGFTVVTEQTVECRGVKMTNFLMEYNFAARDK
jgi:putative acetyltransferase